MMSQLTRAYLDFGQATVLTPFSQKKQSPSPVCLEEDELKLKRPTYRQIYA